MPVKLRVFYFWFVLALGASGCGTNYVTRGADLYAGGHYVEAAEVFELTEQRVPQSSLPDRARYGLYRGATLLALGDSSRAEAWLAFSAKILHETPTALSLEENQMLARALELLATQRSNQPVPGSDNRAAVATRKVLADAPGASNAPSN